MSQPVLLFVFGCSHVGFKQKPMAASVLWFLYFFLWAKTYLRLQYLRTWPLDYGGVYERSLWQELSSLSNWIIAFYIVGGLGREQWEEELVILRSLVRNQCFLTMDVPKWLKEGFFTPFENCTHAQMKTHFLPKKTSAVSMCSYEKSFVHAALPSEQHSESRKHLQDEPQWLSPPHCLSAMATWKTAASPGRSTGTPQMHAGCSLWDGKLDPQGWSVGLIRVDHLGEVAVRQMLCSCGGFPFHAACLQSSASNPLTLLHTWSWSQIVTLSRRAPLPRVFPSVLLVHPEVFPLDFPAGIPLPLRWWPRKGGWWGPSGVRSEPHMADVLLDPRAAKLSFCGSREKLNNLKWGPSKGSGNGNEFCVYLQNGVSFFWNLWHRVWC